ncbi:ABC transporter ATP-binding protein [Candidatus Pelagibacter sp.]|nr:ABC transporter ATP-binding protein [Candidatus Pelagibacter sp.]
MFKNLIKISRILILKSPKNFILMVILLSFQILVISSSVVSIIPLADYIIDPNLTTPSIFTNKFLDVIFFFNIKISFFIFSLFFIVTQFLSAILTSLNAYLILLIKYDFIKKINDESLHCLLSSQWSFFANSNYGDLTNTFLKETEKIGQTVSHIANSLALIFQLFIFILVPLFINLRVTLIVITAFFLFAFLILKIVNPISQKFGRKNVYTSNKMLGKFVDILNSIKTIKINSKEIFFKKIYLEKFDDHVNATLKSQMISQIINAFYRPSGIILILFVFSFFSTKDVLLSELAAIFYSLISIVSILNQLVGLQVNINNFLPSYNQLNKILEDAKSFKENFGDKKFINLSKNIIFKNLNFSYSRDKKVLKNINITINKSEIVALVGKSGSGKTTIADLLCGILIPTKGEILVDNYNLNEIDISDYRRQIGYVSQDVHLFNDTIKNNLIWASDEHKKINDSDIIKALKLSNSYEFIENMEFGINTQIGENGIQLSGGQRQRLSMARVFLKNPQILILDEATSALDSLSEIEIQNSISKLKSYQNITIIVIAHRLSTVKMADKIIVLKDGEIQDQGKYQDLKDKKNELFDAMIS